MSDSRTLAFVSKLVLFLLVTLVSLTGTELLFLSYPKWWYQKQDNIIRSSCERIQPGMSRSDVWHLVKEMGDPYGEWQGDQALDFWGTHGSCTVSLDPKADRVVKQEYSQPAEHFVGVP